MQPSQPLWTVEILRLAIPAAIIVAGWFAAHILATRRDDRTRRQQAVLQFRQRQIEELYGPLVALIEQIFTVWTVRERIVEAQRAGQRMSPEDLERTRLFVWRSYFLPLHAEIRTLLKQKQHLLEGGELPQSFVDYLEHSTQEEFQRRLWEELGIDTSFVPGRSWPSRFDQDAKGGLAAVKAKHEAALRAVEAGT